MISRVKGGAPLLENAWQSRHKGPEVRDRKRATLDCHTFSFYTSQSVILISTGATFEAAFK